MSSEPYNAIILAGGRISGMYARAAGTTIKGLVPVGGTPVVRRVVEALRRAACIERVCVVGPEAVRNAAGEGCLWQAETATALENLEAGIERLGGGGRRLLVCGTDVPAMDAGAVQDFLCRAPEGAGVCMPVVRKAAFVAAFPRSPGIYVRLSEGAFTSGSQYLLHPHLLRENMALLRRLFEQRKSQLAMARTFGARTVWRLVTGRLSISEVEQRASELAGMPCRAVLDCHPGLAYDVDNLFDLRYIERWFVRNSVEPQMNDDERG
jgi:molybdopterin-guanine dinucleotide biosynthesis protein A